MKRLFALQAFVAAALLLAVAVFSARLLSGRLRLAVSIAGRDPATLRPETLEYLGGIRGRVSLTYFVSSEGRLPSAMKGIEDAVRSFLRAVKAAAPDRIDYRVIDPEIDPEHGPSHAAAKGASPVKRRKVLRDETSEEAVWSSLAIARDRARDALVQGITAADLLYLEDLVVGHLRAMERPIEPVIAVAAPARGFTRLLELVARDTGGRVIRCDLERDARVPREADLLFWIEPRQATGDEAEELRRFLASGRTAILAGSRYFVDHLPAGESGKPYRIRLSSCDWDRLLRPFGLAMIPRLLMDNRPEAISWTLEDGSPRRVEAPFQIRVLPSQYDTRSLLGPPAGALVISAASPLAEDRRVLAAADLEAEVVATGSEFNTVMDAMDLAGEELGGEDLAGEPVPKQPWLMLVNSKDPWQGNLLVSGSAALFHDDIYNQGGNANQVFLRTLLRTFTSVDRLVRNRVARIAPPRLPELSLAERVAWRSTVVFLVPAVLLILALRRIGRGGRAGAGAARAPRSGGRSGERLRGASRGGPHRGRAGAGLFTLRRRLAAPVGLAGFALFLVSLRACRSPRAPALDLTRERINTPSPLTESLLEAHRTELVADLVISERMRMPAAMKSVEARLLAAIRGLGIRTRITRPEELPAAEQRALRSAGIVPFEVDTVQDDAPVSVKVWSAIRLWRGARAEAIPRLDQRTVPHLEFLLAAALKRLETGEAPLVGFLSDLPRLSPAEAHQDYQQKGYTAPVGSDVYSAAKDLLHAHGYRVAYINPQEPVFPARMDLLVWLQPRFPAKALPELSAYLARGGKAIVALQHYNIQQRQYRGTGFQTVYWPQPQFHRFNDYLQLCGIRQVGEKLGDEPGEILFDRNRAHLVLDTQVNRSAFREHDPQQVARPFLIRAVGGGLSPDSVITSRLGDLLFIWGNRFAIAPETMSRAGITAEILVTTSPRAWNYRWSGGWIPEEAFAEPEEGLGGPQPLAVLLRGTFPRVEVKREETGRDSLQVMGGPGESESTPGALLLIGCSEMFKNRHLHAAGHEHARFLLNGVALLGHGPEMAELQARQQVLARFPAPDPEVKLVLRLVAAGLGPAVFVAFGIARSLWRRRGLVKPLERPEGAR